MRVQHLILIFGILLCSQVATAAAAPVTASEPDAPHLARLAALGDLNGVRILLDAGVDVSVHEPLHGATALHNAAAQGHQKLVQALLDRGATPASEDHHGATPLIYAAYQGRSEIVQLLLSQGAEVDHRPRQGPTALTAACLRGHQDVVRVLLQAGASPSLVDANELNPRAAADLSGRPAILSLLDHAEREATH